MRIALGVDALRPHPGGIGRYTWELCKGLRRHPSVTQLDFFAHNRLIDDPEALLRGQSLRRRLPVPRAVRRWGLRRQLAASLFHGPNYFLPKAVESGVITVHDLSVTRYPETHPAERIAAFERDFLDSLGRAAHVITDTETIRRELIDGLSIAPERVTAIALGVDSCFSPVPPEANAAPLKQWGLEPGAYGLCISTLEPRKKIAELIRAWRRLPEAIRSRYPLVLAGGSGWRNGDLLEEIARGRGEGWLRHLGFVDEAFLPSLYAGASLFIYPSIYEGFGLPPLEAMASGVPVLVSNRSCLPEVCGDPALYVDPDDPDAFVGAIERGLTDSAWQRSAIERGLARAAGFRWEQCVERTVEIYAKALGEGLAAA